MNHQLHNAEVRSNPITEEDLHGVFTLGAKEGLMEMRDLYSRAISKVLASLGADQVKEELHWLVDFSEKCDVQTLQEHLLSVSAGDFMSLSQTTNTTRP